MGDRSRSRFVDEDRTRLEQMRAAEYPGGVVVDPMPVTAGSEVTIMYYGLLAQCGADQIWLRTGYGDPDNWQDVYDHRMERTGYGWVKNIRVSEDYDRLNFCFKDSANNWDNNNGLNWSFIIHKGDWKV